MPDPTNEVQLLQRVRALLQQDDLNRALAACRELNSRFPGNAEGWCAASVLACRLGNAGKGVEFADRALSIIPEDGHFLIARASAWVQAGRRDSAMSDAEEAVRLASNDAEILDMAGGVSSRCESFERAAEFYERGIALVPGNSRLHFNLGTVKRFLGDNGAAEASFDRAIELNPDDAEAFQLRSDLRTQSRESNHVDELKQRLGKVSGNWRSEMKLQFALAKELEDLDQHEASFDALKKGADLRRRHMSYRVEKDLATIDEIIGFYSPERLAGITPGRGGSGAIFIVGLPRTGTTLVERILGSHDDVQSLGELNEFALEMTRLVRPLLPGKGEGASLVEKSAGIDFQALGSGYLARVSSRRNTEPRFIDKLPLNFLYCGLIHRAMPDARIVHVTRNPMDACFAMYKRLFRDAYPMSYDLDDLGRYYCSYRKLMQHWHSVLPDVIHEVAYESLIEAQDSVTRDLLSYCDLPWQEDCLKFEENSAAATTASASQVRQPIYRSSVNNWRNYRDQLGHLRQVLANEGVNVDKDSW